MAALFLTGCSAPGPERTRYPPHWFAAAPESEAASWEILPQAAGPGEVILSKRHELGLLSNFAPTPFTLDGERYASLEGFWQMMLYPEGPDDPRARAVPRWPHARREVAAMTGFDAKRAGQEAEKLLAAAGVRFMSYRGIRFDPDGADRELHVGLVLRAMRAKLAQNPRVREALLATGDLRLRPDHRQPEDAPPAWRYHEIWMRFREELRAGTFVAPRE